MSKRAKSKRTKKPGGITVALHFEERMMLSTLLARAEADIIMLRIVRTLREQLSPSEKEAKALNIRQVGGGTAWDAKGDKLIEFEIGPKLLELIAGMLRAASDRKTLTLPQLVLYEKFIPRDEEEPEPVRGEEPTPIRGEGQ